MRIVNSSVNLIQQEKGINGIFRQIERCGRVCYKSEDGITDGSASKFFNKLLSSKHLAMLEHGTVYLTIPLDNSNITLINRFRNNNYSIVNMVEGNTYITTNMRVLVENFTEEEWKGILKVYNLDSPSKFHNKRITAHFIISRGIANEFVRHRVFSFAQESTRFCNYSKDKFGNEITLIKPSWVVIPDGILKPDGGINPDGINWEEVDDDINIEWLEVMNWSEQYYFDLINHGLKPQDARGVLPLDLKTELIMTGTYEQWQGFFDLRYFEKTGPAHPDAKSIACKWYNLVNGIAGN